MDLREAWRRKHRAEARPWSGPVHAAPLLAGLTGRIVELGAGGGKVGGALPPDALALDWAPESLRDAKRPRIVADARRLPFRDASLDALVAIHVLGHWPHADREAAAREWARVLRPGGALVLEAFAAGDAREGAGRPVEPGTWEREGILTHYFGREEMDALFAGWEGGLAVEERRLPWGLRRVLRGRLRAPPSRGA